MYCCRVMRVRFKRIVIDIFTCPSLHSPKSLNQAEFVGEFLNSMLDCPLPIDALVHLAEFLQVTDASTKHVPQGSMTRPVAPRIDAAEGSNLAKEIYTLLSLCEIGILRAENHTNLAGKLDSTGDAKSPSVPLLEVPPSLSNTATISFDFQDAIHAALMTVMEERDEAHARMVAADVIHIHEMEQQRKKLNQMTAQIQSGPNATSPASAPQQAPKSQRLMQQDSDAELVALCQQLSTEISGRTSADMELTRLREIRHIEREAEMREKKALQAEIEKLTRLLGREREKADMARLESDSWKQSYEEMLQAGASSL
jgi:hypothetical protein